MPANNTLIADLRASLEMDLGETISMEELKQKLSGHINHLITNDFNKLISLLYRLDISESKLKKMLADNADMDAGLILADLIIERQAEKIRSREHFRQTGENSIDENEKW